MKTCRACHVALPKRVFNKHPSGVAMTLYGLMSPRRKQQIRTCLAEA